MSQKEWHTARFFPFWGQANILNAEIWSSPTFLLPACPSHSTGGLFPAGPQSNVSADSAASGQPSMDHCPTPNTQPRLTTQLTGPERGQGLSKPRRLWEDRTTRWSLTSKPWARLHPSTEYVQDCSLCSPACPELWSSCLPVQHCHCCRLPWGCFAFLTTKGTSRHKERKALSNLLCSAYSKGQTADKDCRHSFLTAQPGRLARAPNSHWTSEKVISSLFVFISPC